MYITLPDDFFYAGIHNLQLKYMDCRLLIIQCTYMFCLMVAMSLFLLNCWLTLIQVIDVTPPRRTGNSRPELGVNIKQQHSRESQASDTSATSKKRRRRSDKCFIFLFW